VIGDEKCDDKKKGGCKEDCSGNKEGYTCTGGNETSPSLCIKTEFITGLGILTAQSLGYIGIVLAISTSPSMGPQMFILVGINILIKSLPFISKFHNHYVEDFLRKGP
jgi:hypothetical protein